MYLQIMEHLAYRSEVATGVQFCGHTGGEAVDK